MSLYNDEYLLLFFTLCLGLVVAGFMLIANGLIRNVKRLYILDLEKLSIYECGFEPFEETRTRFHIHFYIVGILFLIFDVELIYVIPFITLITDIPEYSYSFDALYFFFIFLTMLALGYLYELRLGAIKW